MVDGVGCAAGGLRRVTYAPVWGVYTGPNATWPLKIAFLLHRQQSGSGGLAGVPGAAAGVAMGASHGGLLSADVEATAAGYCTAMRSRGAATRHPGCRASGGWTSHRQSIHVCMCWAAATAAAMAAVPMPAAE